MQRSVWKWGTVALFGLLVTACADEGVGDPCIPETIPCKVDDNGNKQCGFNNTESFIEASSVQCRSRLCIVHKLDNGTDGNTPADPSKNCGPNVTVEQGCVKPEELDKSVYCTCRCRGPGKKEDFCDCPSGFTCEDVLSLGGDGIRGGYCVRN